MYAAGTIRPTSVASTVASPAVTAIATIAAIFLLSRDFGLATLVGICVEIEVLRVNDPRETSELT